jgi:hypothetical protein
MNAALKAAVCLAVCLTGFTWLPPDAGGTDIHPPEALARSMAAFREAMADGDSAEIYKHLPRRGILEYAAYDVDTRLPLAYKTVPAGRLQQDLSSGGEWQRFFLAEPNGYEYRANFKPREKWLYRGGGIYFAPHDRSGNTYLQWRLSQKGWVIREIGETVP